MFISKMCSFLLKNLGKEKFKEKKETRRNPYSPITQLQYLLLKPILYCIATPFSHHLFQIIWEPIPISFFPSICFSLCLSKMQAFKKYEHYTIITSRKLKIQLILTNI